MADDKKKFVIANDEFDDIDTTTKNVVITDSEFDDIDDSPKPPAPSTKGGESGALVRPLTPTSASEDSESESWTQTVNPFADKGAVKPTQQAQKAGVAETPLTKKDKGVVIPKTYTPTLQENIAKIEGMTMRAKFPEYSNIQKGAFDFKQASAESISKEEQAQKEQTLKRKEERRVQNLPNEIEALRKERADLLLDKSPEAKKKIAANEAVTKKMQQELNNLNNSKYESLKNLNQRAIKDIDLEVNEYLEEDPKLKDKIKAVGLTETETWDLAQKAIAKKIAPLEADLQMFKSEGTVDAASAKINLANSLRNKQEKMTAIAGQMKSYETDYLNKTGFSGLNKELETTKKKLDSYEPYLKRANSEVKLHEKELTDLKTKLDSFSSLIKDNTFLGTAAQFEELRAIEKEYNNTIQDLNNVYKNESLLGYEDAVNNYNSLIAKKNNLVSGLKSTEYQKMANDLDALKLDYDMSYEDYSKYEEPKVKDRINQYFSTIQKIGEYDEKLKTTKGELSYIGELEKAQEKFNNTGVGGDFLDIGARAVNSILDASKKLVASPFRLAASFSDLAGKGSGTYHYSDWVADLIEGTGYEPLFLTKKTNNLYDAKSDKINLGFSPILGAVADQTGIILTLALTGKYSNPVVQRAMTTAGMDLTAIAEVSESAKIATTIAPAFMISYGDNYKEALSKGFSVEGAMAFGGGLSLLEGLTETMLPDQDLVFGKDVKNQLLNRFIKDYSKGKKYAIKNLAQNFLYNAGSEITEENIAALGKTIATSIGNLTSDDIEVEIPTINQTVTTAITSGLSGGGMGLFGSVSEQSQMYKLGVMNLANDFKTGKELLDKFKEKGKITDERYNKLISDAQKFQSVRGQIPNGLSGYKVMAIAEKMIAIRALSADMNDDKNNPINKINQKKISKIQDEVEAIIDDENFDKRAEYELNLEAENLDKQQQEKPATAEGEVVLTKNTSPTNDKYGTINRNDGKGVVDLTKEEFEAEQAKMQPKVDEQVTPIAEGEQVPKTKEEIVAEIELKNEGKAEAPTKKSVTERLNINNPFYQKVEDALVKLGLIEKYNPETGTGDVVGGYAQQTSDGGFSAGKMLFSQDGSISYFDGDVKVSFDKNGNVISENTKEAKQKAVSLEIESKKESIANLEKTRDSEAFKYKEVTETDVLGNKKKVKRLKTEQELKESTDKINAAIDKAKNEITELEKQNEKEPTKKEDGKPMSGGVQGVRIEGEGGKESAELRPEEEEEVTPQEGSISEIDIERKKDELERKYGKIFINEETYHLIRGTDGNYYINHVDRGERIKSYKFQTEEQAKKFAEKEGIELLTIAQQGVGFTSENKAKYDAEIKLLEQSIKATSTTQKEEATPQAGSVVGGEGELPILKQEPKIEKVKDIYELFDNKGNRIAYIRPTQLSKDKELNTVSVKYVKSFQEGSGNAKKIYQKLLDELPSNILGIRFGDNVVDKKIKGIYKSLGAEEINGELIIKNPNYKSEQSLQSTPTTEEEVSGGLTQEEKVNLENISKDAGVNFQEVRNVYNKYGEGKPLNEITLEDYQKAEEKRQGGKEKEVVELKEEASPKEKLFSKVRAYNNLSKRERSDMFGNKLRADIMSDAAAIKYTIRPTKSGNYILIDDRGKQVRAIGTPRSKDAIQEEKRIKERRSRAKRELPLSIKHSVAQDIANGVKFNRKELKDVTGWDDADIPFWLTVNEGGVSLEFYNVRFQEKGGFLVEDDMNFVSDVADAIRDFAFNKGRTAALEFIEKQQEIIENGGFTDAELQEQMEYYQAKLDEENFDYFAEYLSNLSDEEAQLLSDELREAEKENDKLLINEILNENENQRKTEQGEQDANIEALDIERESKEREAKIAEIEENIKNLQNSVAKKQRQADKLSKEAQGDVFRGTKAQMFDAGEELRQLTKDTREQNAEIERQKEKLAELKEKQIQPSNQLKIEEDAVQKQAAGQVPIQPKEPTAEEVEEEGLPKLTKEQQIEAERRSLNEPKNVSDLAKIFNKILGLSPKESVMAARLFDVKAKNMSELLGITKDEYYQRYWFTGEQEGGLSQIIGEQGAARIENALPNLEKAKSMYGKEPNWKIKRDTGWEKGIDGKWRFEISPVSLRSDFIIDENSVWNHVNEADGNQVVFNLNEVADMSILEQLYPSLKNAEFVFTKMKSGDRGAIIKTKDGKTIVYVNANEFIKDGTLDRDELRKTIVHEVQHGIQDIERFAQGTNLSAANKQVQNEIKEINDLLESGNINFYEKLKLLYKKRKLSKESKFGRYLRTAGEVEARNVVKRISFSDISRAVNTLKETEDIKRKNQIVITEDSLKSNSKLFQGDRRGAWSKIAASAKRIISMYDKARLDTAVHEILGHDFLDEIISLSATNKEFEQDLNTIIDEYIKSSGNKTSKTTLLNELKNFNVESNNQSVNARAIHEWFSRTAEGYFMGETNIKPDSKLAKMFEQFRQYLTDLFNTMTSRNYIIPSEPMKQIFRKAFGAENFDFVNDYAEANIMEGKLDVLRITENEIPQSRLDKFKKLREAKRGLGQEEDVDIDELVDAARYLSTDPTVNVFSVVDELVSMYPQKEEYIRKHSKTFEKVFVAEGKKVRETARSVYESEVVSPEMKQRAATIEDLFSYTPEKLQEKMEDVESLIADYSIDDLMAFFATNNEIPFKEYPLFLAAMQKRISRAINELNNSNQGQSAAKQKLLNYEMTIMDRYIAEGTATGQRLNYFKVLKNMSTDGKLRFFKRKFKEESGNAVKEFQDLISNLRKERDKAYKDNDYFLEENLSLEQRIEDLEAELAKERSTKAKNDKRKDRESLSQAKPPKRKISQSELNDILKELGSAGLGQSLEDLNAALKLGFYIIQDKPKTIEQFTRDWNKITKQNKTQEELSQVYRDVRKYATENEGVDIDYFDSDAMIQSSIDSFNERASQKKNLAKKELDSDIAKAEKEAMKTQMSEKDKEVKAKEALKKREKEIRDNFLDSLSQDGLWQQYVKSVSGRILGNLGSKLGAKQSEKALLDEFTELATKELNKAIDELMPKQKGGKAATPNYAQQLGDLIANQEKLADIFDKAVKDFAEKNKGNANAQSVLSKLNGLKNPFSEKLMENALENEAQNYAIKIGDLAFKYAGLRQNLKGQIVAQIVAETGLTGQQATQLEQDLRAKFDNIIAETEQDTAGQLAKAILSNAKKELGLGKKQQDYVKELLGYLKNKAKDYYKTTNKQALVDPFEQLKYAVEMLNDANGRKIWDDSKAELIAKIDSDKDLSQQEKDDLKAYLDDYQNAIFDQLLSKNKLFNNVKKVLAEESPFVKKDGSVDWNGIIIQAKGNVEIAKQIILDSVADKLQGYSGSQVNSVIDAIGREYQRRINEKRAEIIEKQLKDISDKKVIFKKKIATGFVQKLVEMENSGALGDQRFEQALKEWIGFSDMTPDKWNRLRELIVDAEEAPEGNERDRAIENLSAYIKFNKIGKFAEIYSSAYYAGLLARPTTIIKNSTGIIEPLLTLFYKSFTDRNYAKAMLQGLKRGDAADIWGGGLVQGGKLDEEVGNDGLPRVNMLKQWKMQQKGIIPKLFALGAKPLDLLSMADALSQAMVERGAEYEFYARYLLEKNKEDIRNGVQGVAPITEKEARRIAIKRLSDDAMLDWAFAQAEDEFASRKIVPSSARLNRRAYEIVSESLLPTSVRELAQNLALEESYKSKLISFRGMTAQTRAQKRLETNYGVATFIGSFTKGLVDLLAAGGGYVAGGATKVLPVTEARRNQIRNSVERAISMRVLPFARGISNVVEKGLEKTPYGIVSGVIGATAEKLSYGKPKTIDEILQHQYMMNRNKAKIAKSATSMIIGSAIYYTLLSASKEWDDEEEKEERYYLPTGFYSAGEAVRFGKDKIERYTLPVNCVVLYGRIIPLSLFGTVGIGSMITAQAYDNFLSKEKKKQGAVVDPDNPESIKGFSSFVSSSGNAILNMSAMQSISELQESVSSKGTMDFGDYALKLSVKSIALPIPFSGTANQIIQGARYLSGDKTAQAAIGADEKIYKELGLAGIVYNRPVLDWRGRPVNAVLQNQEGIASFVSMLDKRPLDKIDMYLLKELEFNPVIDKRLSENFADLNMVGMSKDEYYDYTKNVGRTVNNYIEAYFDKIKDYQIPQDKIDELAAEGKNEADLKKQLKTIKKTFVSDFLNIAEQEHMLNYQFKKGIIKESYEAKVRANNDRLKNLIEKINNKGE